MAIKDKRSKTTKQSNTVFERINWLYRLAIIIIFLGGIGIRLYDVTDAPLDFHATRQLYSALKARGMYYQNLETVPDWQRELAVSQWKAQGLIEPPVMEQLAAMTYGITGQELLWIPRLYAIFFWVLGGLGLLLLTREVAGKNGAIFSLAFYFFTPYLVFASRSFQPDPLMVALMIYAIYGLVKWERTALMKWAVLAGLFAGLAIFIKTVVIFPIAVAFAVVPLTKYGLRAAIRNWQVWIMAALSLIPYLLFYSYGLFISGELQPQFNLRFFPQLWLTPEFWLQWNSNISRVIGLEFFLASILGTFMLARKTDRFMVIGMFAGYFIYGMTLSYHISTHDYYQMPLVPVAAIGLAMLFQKTISSLEGADWAKTLITVTVLLYFVLIKGWDVRVDLKRHDFRSEISAWQNISAQFPQGASIIGMTQDYGYRMEYWGWRHIQNWLSAGDISLREMAGQEFDMAAWFNEAVKNQQFFLVTQFDELDRQPVVKQLLEENYPVWKASSGYIIYDLRNPISP